MKVMIVGAGKLGTKLAEFLLHEDTDITVLDTENTPLGKLSENFDVMTVQANGLEISILKELNIETFDIVIASTNNDESNVLIATISKRLGAKKVIARIRKPEYLEQMNFIKDEMDIDLFINPDMETARVITKYITNDQSFVSGDFARGEIKLMNFSIGNNPDFVGKQFHEVEAFKPVVVATVSRDGEMIIPNGKTVLKEDDVLLVAGMSKDIENFAKIIDIKEPDHSVRTVMIVGGGKLGYYLSHFLMKRGLNIIIIEKDKKRAQTLSELIPDALVINADGTDIDLLEKEHLENCDAFLCCAGVDEINLLMAIVAKNHGVERTIAITSRHNYTNIVERLGIDIAFNPIYITASNILKYIRGGRVISVSLLLGGNAEASELIVNPQSPLVGIALKDLELPEGMLVVAILREGKTFIPDGKTALKAADRVIVYTLSENLPYLKNFIHDEGKKKGFLNELFNGSKNNRRNPMD